MDTGVDDAATVTVDQARHLTVMPIGRSILLVEDSPADAELVADFFESRVDQGTFSLEHVSRLDAAITRLAEAAVDCVLLDLSLPDSKGVEGVMAMRRSAPQVPIVVLTGLRDGAVGEAAVRLGAQDFLVKGELTASALVRSVSYAIERHGQQVLLQAAQARFQRAFDSAPIGMALLDLDGCFLEVNPVLADMLNYREPQLSVRIWDVLHRDDIEAFALGFARLGNGRLTTFRAECRLTGPNGREVWAMLAVAAVTGKDESEAPSMIVHAQDITTRKEAEARLVRQALHDSLTGLPNRVLLQDRLEQALSRLDRKPESLAVCYLDLDRFKFVNDTLGHHGGDQVLIEISRRLEHLIRPADTVARLGGDEFVILAEGLTGRDEVEAIAERVRIGVGQPIVVDDVEIVSSVSIGIAIAGERHSRPEQLLREADTAMYRAKGRGKDRYEIADEALLAQTMARVTIENTIRRSIDENRLVAVYQPIVSLTTGRVVGAEALLRIEDPPRGLVSPAEFIGVAEETGLIVPMGHWILTEAIEQAAVWRGYFPDICFKMAVNLSARQVALPTLAADLAALLEANAIDPVNVCLELTESVLMDAASSTISNLTALKALGVGLGIDDFGTGYSSLTYLRSFPVDFVKIDQSFVAGLPDNEDDRSIVTAVIALGRSLGLTSIAEGVETAAQLDLLRDLGCDEFQGYYFSRPRPASELSEIFANRALDWRV